jgi:hypothetical protein
MENLMEKSEIVKPPVETQLTRPLKILAPSDNRTYL